MKKNVILSFASNYSYYEMQPFVESWKNTQKAELYIFYLDLSQWTKECLEYNGVHLISVDDDLRDEKKDYCFLRMEAISRFLKKNADIIYQVAIVDIRDAVFQNDCFFNKQGKAYLGLNCECTTNKNPVQSGWITRLLDDVEWENEYGGEPLINAGVIWGTVDEILSFYNEVINFCKNKEMYFGIDQAAINHVVYGKLIDSDIIYSHAGDGKVVSIIHNLSDYKTDDENIIRVKDGNSPSIVHQYDRSDLLTNFVNIKYRKEKPCISSEYQDVRSELEKVRFLLLIKDFDRALEVSTKLDGKLGGYEICFPIIWEILDNIYKEKNITACLIVNYVLIALLNVFSKMHINDKVRFIDRVISFFKLSNNTNKYIMDRFGREVFLVIKYFVDIKDWKKAEIYAGEITGLHFNMEELYFLLARIYRYALKIREAKYNYILACVIEVKNKFSYLNYNQYVDLLFDMKEDLVIFIATKDTHTIPGSRKEMRMEKFGIKTNLNDTFRYSWLCVIDEGKVVKELCSKNEVVSTEYQWGKNTSKVVSAGFTSRQDYGSCVPTSIRLNGKELCLNQRGLNFVVLNKSLGMVLDSVAFDIYDNEKVYRMNLSV